MGRLVPLAACAGDTIGRVGRKAAVLGWAEANGVATPGGFVLPAARFWAAVDACGAGAQARYLEGSVLRLDPRHALDLAGSIRGALAAGALDQAATADAAEAFDRIGGGRVVCRSSAAMEDGDAAAFPGVFLSVLDIGSPSALAAAIAATWRSAFSADAIRYLLRVGAEPVDFSLAVLVQTQVEAPWYGLYVSADPVTGADGPLADLSDQGPDALVTGARATLRARRQDGRWTGADGIPGLAASLEAVHRAAARLRAHLGAGVDVDVEFALPEPGREPVVLQCRPLRPGGGARIAPDLPDDDGHGRRVRGRGCAPGRATGMVTDPRGSAGGAGIAVVEDLTTADYGIVFGHAAVVTERDASPLSHVALLCRELGVAFVCGVDGARALLLGRRAAVDGGSGVVTILDHADEPSPSPPPRRAPATEETLGSLELLLRVLAESRPGADPVREAQRILRRYRRALGSPPVRLTGQPVTPTDFEALDRVGVEVFGPDFSSRAFLAQVTGGASVDFRGVPDVEERGVAGRRGGRHRHPPRPGG